MRKQLQVTAALLACLLPALFVASCTQPLPDSSSMAPSSSQSAPVSSSGPQNGRGEDPTLVQTALGPVQGVLEGETAVFKGIPYAAPPLGEYRFAPPQPAESWEDPLDCSEFGEMALQLEGARNESLSYGEDCLTLNIWGPAEGEGLPVYVFIHGGGFTQGAAGLPMYDGARFAQDGVIQVNIGYRLGAFGFLATQEGLNEYGALGNQALLDQIAALEWINENIEAFGGDVGNITVGGESAGAFSVSNLIMSPLAEGLFQKAILESGNLLGQSIIVPDGNGDAAQALAAGEAFLQTMGAADLAALREMDAGAITQTGAFSLDMTSPSPFSLWPVFDGAVLPEDPLAALQEGDYNPVSILTGYNTDEGVLFIPEGISEATYVELVQRTFGDDAPQVLARYPVDTGHSATDRARFIMTVSLRIGGDLFADAFAAAGLDVYYYHFSYPGTYGAALHAAELVYVFDTAGPLDAAAEAFKEDLHARWLAYIQTGDPGGGTNGVQWPKYTPQGKDILQLDLETQAATLSGTEDIAFFASLL